MRQKGFASVFVILIVIVLAAGGYLYYQNQQRQQSSALFTPTPTVVVQDVYREVAPLPVEEDTLSPTRATQIQVNGADVKNITYTLPEGWTSKLNRIRLELANESLGGYVHVEVHTFNEQTGRRAFYCSIADVCIDGQTKFQEITIGNISGYEPFPIDNSGGGPEYFGAKGNTFYRISTYCPLQNPDEFDPNNACNTSRMKILNSFVF